LTVDLRTDEIPEAWTGSRVYVGLLVPTKGSAPASGTFKVGTLERVGVFGIVGTFTDPDEEEEDIPARAFYPWSAVLTIASAEEVRGTLGL
jgi:hypothetical protein